MKTVNIIRYCVLLLAGLLSAAGVVAQQVPGFQVLGRQPLAADKGGRIALSAGTDAVTISNEVRAGKQFYRVEGNGVQATVPALTYVETPAGSGRIWVYGDSAGRHIVDNVYASVYSNTGTLVRSVGKLGRQPYAVATANNGSLVFAGNSGKDTGRINLILALYDFNGNRTWQVNLPEGRASRVFISPDNKYIAVVHFNNKKYLSSTLVYDGSGRLVQTLPHNADGVDFLSSGKLVISDGRSWFLYDGAKGFQLLHQGSLPGNAIGKFPVTSHPSRDIFFIMTADAAVKGVRLQAFDAQQGTLLAQGSFKGKDTWQPYRQVAVNNAGSIQLTTGDEVITLGMK
ncbi:hypothetical protein D3H65_13300 [Paraflavitalea soli]|uniref:WD40 repeat domain-containing protein n=1 Tax=Paraflavitalea soli TaxID=2315862 RepID=A0A3B7MKC2_9BACT|nr:hypothetical protein [Paraflavitalea soli]AXY74904.1 hypothetical protein D3H65_13300 [Paraflavitalea soli]